MEAGELRDQLLEKLESVNAAPFLFVGSGLSRRYLDLDDWEGTLRRFAGLTERPYEYYAAHADEGDLPHVASLIAQDFDERWWNEDRYAEQRDRLQQDCQTVSSPLKFQISEFMRSISAPAEIPTEFSEEIETLRRATIGGIITTNWDTLLEQLFDYTVFASQEEVLASRQASIAEIYKIHGCCRQPNSLVLTSEDYEDFNEKNVYLAAKLTTIFLEHPVVFLGYSFHDTNIQHLLSSLSGCLSEERLRALGENLIFIQRAKGSPPSIGPSTISAGEHRLEALRVTANSFTPIYEALARAEQHLDARLLRQIKSRVYELVQTNDPQGQLHVVDIEDLDDHDDVEVVVGVGVYGKLGSRGIVGIEIDELFDDLVNEGSEFDEVADDIVMQTIRGWLNPRAKYTPLYKYLKLAGLLNEDNTPLANELPPNVMRIAELPRQTYEYNVSERRQATYRSLTVKEVIRERPDSSSAAHYLSLVQDPTPHELLSFLQENKDQMTRTRFKKLACIYDRIEYGPGF